MFYSYGVFDGFSVVCGCYCVFFRDLCYFYFSNSVFVCLDCFCGSGTTLRVAREHNRKYIGMDNSPVSRNLLSDDFYYDTRIIIK
ncbi:DNA methyltransferase [Methanobrevibacter sp.]|uniref:DNA methyltransferase n=1 Tax=Methanobrevibacter sp. TaxID=66852 RepID=UPI003867F2CF